MAISTVPSASAAKTLGFLLDGQWLNEGEPVQILAPYDRSVAGENRADTLTGYSGTATYTYQAGGDPSLGYGCTVPLFL